MADIGAGLSVGASVLGSVMGSNAQESAANTAADAQSASAMAGIAEQRRQFDAMRELLSPYVNAGTRGLTGQQNLIGLYGAGAQQREISGLSSSPLFRSLTQQGENAMLQNASATGGLRGGNLQGALAQYRPAMLNNLIQQQYQNLGGLSSMGENAASGVGNAGMQTGGNIANLLSQQGAAQAGAALAGGQAQANMWGSLGGAAGVLGGRLGGGNIGGGTSIPIKF